MTEDGKRLFLSIRHDSFSITDNLTGKIFIATAPGCKVTACTLDSESIIKHIDNIQEALTTFKRVNKWRSKEEPLSSNSTLIIREEAHHWWTISYGGLVAIVKNGSIITTKSFDVTLVLRKINFVRSILYNNTTQKLTPQLDTVRRIAECGAVLWNYKNHHIFGYECNISGCTMIDCFVDRIYHKLIFVSVSEDKNEVNVFDKKLNLLFSCPLDDSIRYFYKDDSEDL